MNNSLINNVSYKFSNTPEKKEKGLFCNIDKNCDVSVPVLCLDQEKNYDLA